MKIAHFVYDDPYNPWVAGGGSIRNYFIYSYFPKSWSIDVFTGSFPGASDIKKKTNRITVHYLGNKNRSYLQSRINYVRKARLFIRKNSQNYDLIIEDFSAYSPVLASRLIRKKPLIVQVQNYFGISHNIKKWGPLGIPVYLFLEKKGLASFRNYIFSSKDLKDQIPGSILSSGKSFKVVPNGVSDDLLKCRCPSKSKYLLYLGRFEFYQKGLDLLLHYFKDFSTDQKLVLAGSGRDEARLKKLIKKLGLEDRTEIIGRVDGKKKMKILAEASVCLIPSRYESWGIVSLEAQACGTPVLAASIPGLRLTVQEGKTGLLFNGKDDFINKAEILLQDKTKLKKMGADCKKFAREFTWSRISKMQRSYYEQVMKK